VTESEKSLDPDWNLCSETRRVPRCPNHTVRRKGKVCGTCYHWIRRQKDPYYIKVLRKCQYEKHRELVLATQGLYYSKNREKILKYQKEYRRKRAIQSD
jgi:hypothetical protein